MNSTIHPAAPANVAELFVLFNSTFQCPPANGTVSQSTVRASEHPLAREIR